MWRVLEAHFYETLNRSSSLYRATSAAPNKHSQGFSLVNSLTRHAEFHFTESASGFATARRVSSHASPLAVPGTTIFCLWSGRSLLNLGDQEPRQSHLFEQIWMSDNVRGAKLIVKVPDERQIQWRFWGSQIWFRVMYAERTRMPLLG